MKILTILLLLVQASSWAMEISYSVVDVETNEFVSYRDHDKQMHLASVSKLYSFYYVLNQLDPMATFETNVLQSKGSKVKDGVLKGDLILKGSGDPHLTAQNFINLIYQIKGKGIKKVEGKFIVDTNKVWSTDRLSSLGLEDQADNSSMGALNFEYNRFRVDRVSNRPIPKMDYLQIEDKFIKDQPGLKFQFVEKNKKNEKWIKNKSEKHGFREEVPTRNSNLFSAHFFRHLAGIHNLELPEPVVESTSRGKVIATHESLPVYRLIELGLEYSNNVIAEMLLIKSTKSDPKRSTFKMLDWYKKKFPSKDFDWDKTKLVNASGLTLDNKTTAKNLALLLAEIYSDKEIKRNFLSYLSISGHSGGLKNRFRENYNSYTVYGKTGSLYYVNNLAGYFRSNKGKLFAFSIFVTDSKKRAALNAPNSTKVNQLRKRNKTWYNDSMTQLDSQLKRLMNRL